MDITPAGSNESIGEEERPAEYRIRVWTAPSMAKFSWLVDEWDARDAEDVLEAVGWAQREAAGRPVEVFLKWSEQKINRSGGVDVVPRMTRVFGAPGDEDSTTETVYFYEEKPQAIPPAASPDSTI
ncbi:hypothetical protein ABC337_06370 [Arthrobacter sp. 1P04PC]|uniref:hypothetical protein n=1 Tax=unclassified Arthrobacter TaxID=235627 RepID=UPI00342DC257